MKKITLFLIALVLALALVACGGAAPETAEPTGEATGGGAEMAGTAAPAPKLRRDVLSEGHISRPIRRFSVLMNHRRVLQRVPNAVGQTTEKPSLVLETAGRVIDHLYNDIYI